MRRQNESERRDGDDDKDGECCVEAPVAAADEPPDEEEERREQEVEPLFDRKTPGDRIEVDSIGGAEQVLDVEEIAQEIGSQEIARHQSDRDQRNDIGRDRAHPAAGEKHPQVAPGFADHPVDDLRREHEAAEDEEDLDAGDGDGVGVGAERRVGRQVMRDCDCKGRRAAQKIERRAAPHAGGVYTNGALTV